MNEDGTAVAERADEQEDTRTEEQKVADAERAAERRGVAIEEARERGVLAPARLGWDPAQVEAVKRTVAKDCNDAEFVMFLELCARYELDPFAKQIYAAKMQGGVQIIVSRDGLLAHAHRQTDFISMVGDVVHENDTFKVTYDEQGERRVTHEYSGWKDRGEIVGAWTVVKREGHGSTYFFAPFEEYKGKNVWEKNPSAMILKVAETYALRKAYSISGVVGEEEVERTRREPADLSALPDEPEWGDDEELAERLKTLVDRANEVKPGSYRPQKVRTMLQGVSEQKRYEIAAELEQFIDQHAPPEGAGAEEEVHDAEVVEDGTDNNNGGESAEKAEG